MNDGIHSIDISNPLIQVEKILSYVSILAPRDSPELSFTCSQGNKFDNSRSERYTSKMRPRDREGKVVNKPLVLKNLPQGLFPETPKLEIILGMRYLRRHSKIESLTSQVAKSRAITLTHCSMSY